MRRIPLSIAVTTAILALVVAGGWYLVRSSHAARRIGEREIYRSAQPSPSDLRRLSKKAGLQTVINLRGPNENEEWFQRERDAAEEHGLRLVSLPFESFDYPPRIETLALLEELETADAPILLHCHSGIDRSGWAAGVVRLLGGESIDVAENELQHWCSRDQCALHEFFDSYRAHLAELSLSHDKDSFRRWVIEDYYPEPYRARIQTATPPPESVSPGATVAIEVEILNESSSPWIAGTKKTRGIRPGARILGPFETIPDDVVELFRSSENLYSDVFRDHREGLWPPGEARTVGMSFAAPDSEGLWAVQIDMVHEGIHWFSDLGDPGLILTMRVE